VRVELVALRWGGASWLGVCGHTPASPVLALEGEPGGVNGGLSGERLSVFRVAWMWEVQPPPHTRETEETGDTAASPNSKRGFA